MLGRQKQQSRRWGGKANKLDDGRLADERGVWTRPEGLSGIWGPMIGVPPCLFGCNDCRTEPGSSPGQNMALTVLFVPTALQRGGVHSEGDTRGTQRHVGSHDQCATLPSISISIFISISLSRYSSQRAGPRREIVGTPVRQHEHLPVHRRLQRFHLSGLRT